MKISVPWSHGKGQQSPASQRPGPAARTRTPAEPGQPLPRQTSLADRVAAPTPDALRSAAPGLNREGASPLQPPPVEDISTLVPGAGAGVVDGDAAVKPSPGLMDVFAEEVSVDPGSSRLAATLPEVTAQHLADEADNLLAELKVKMPGW